VRFFYFGIDELAMKHYGRVGERRRVQRTDCFYSGEFAPSVVTTGDGDRAVFLLDFSPEGMSFYCAPGLFVVGQEISLPMGATCKVIYVNPVENGSGELVGVQFVKKHQLSEATEGIWGLLIAACQRIMTEMRTSISQLIAEIEKNSTKINKTLTLARQNHSRQRDELEPIQNLLFRCGQEAYPQATQLEALMGVIRGGRVK
jgi:hypothetical protein